MNSTGTGKLTSFLSLLKLMTCRNTSFHFSFSIIFHISFSLSLSLSELCVVFLLMMLWPLCNVWIMTDNLPNLQPRKRAVMFMFSAALREMFMWNDEDVESNTRQKQGPRHSCWTKNTNTYSYIWIIFTYTYSPLATLFLSIIIISLIVIYNNMCGGLFFVFFVVVFFCT